MLRLLPFAALILGLLSQSAFAQARLVTTLAPVTVSRSTPAAPVEPNDLEKRAFEQTNVVRVQNGLPPLTWDSDICRMARVHSESMSRQQYFSHVTPEGLHLR